MRDIVKMLKNFVNYYTKIRQVGHTKTVLTGAFNNNCIVAVSCSGMASNIYRSPFATLAHKTNYLCVSLEAEPYIRLYNKPLVFDNGALLEIFEESLNKIEQLENELNLANLHIIDLEQKLK